MSNIRFLPKCKTYNTITIENSNPVTQSMSHPSLPHYTNFTSKSDTDQLNSTPLENTEDIFKNELFVSTIFLTSVFCTFLHMIPVDHFLT